MAFNQFFLIEQNKKNQALKDWLVQIKAVIDLVPFREIVKKIFIEKNKKRARPNIGINYKMFNLACIGGFKRRRIVIQI